MTIDLTQDAALFLSTDGFGETVRYTPLGGVARDIDVKFFDADMRADPYSNEMTYARPMALAKASDLTDLTQGATIIRGSVTYLCLLPDPSLVAVTPFILVELAKQ